jgi:hypothetical protein
MLLLITVVCTAALVAALCVHTPNTFLFDLINDSLCHETTESRR